MRIILVIKIIDFFIENVIRFSIKMKFLYHETIFLICENKKTKDKKTNYVIECIIIIVFFILKKLRYIECQIT